MGPTVNKDQSLNMKYWVPINQPKDALFPNINVHRNRLLLNTVNHQYIEEYNLHFVSHEDRQHYLSQTQWRREISHPPPQIYPIKHFQDTSTNELCNTINTGSIYLQKVEMRLKEINDIPYHDSLYLLRNTLNGFKILFMKYGNFEVRQDMIFIDKAGKVKVWINSNLSLEIPHHTNVYEAQMVTSLITMIERNIDNQDVGKPLFSHYLRRKELFNNCSFAQCIRELQEFTGSLNIKIPDFMKSVFVLYQDGTNKSYFQSRLIYNNSQTSPSNNNKSRFANESSLQRSNNSPNQNQNRLKATHSYHSFNKPTLGLIVNSPNHQNYSEKNIKTKPVTPSMKPKKGQTAQQYYRVQNFKNVKNLQNVKAIKYSPVQNSVKTRQQVSKIISPPHNFSSIRSPQNKAKIHFTPSSQPLNSNLRQKRATNASKEVIKFNYIPSFSESIPQKKVVKNQIHNLKYKQKRLKKPFFEANERTLASKYYSSHDTYELDAEIAADLKSFLGQTVK